MNRSERRALASRSKKSHSSLLAYVAPAGFEVTPWEVIDGGPQIDPDLYLETLEPAAKAFAYGVRKQKRDGVRPLPSASLVSIGDTPPSETRLGLLDQIAQLVDEHVIGRSDMCFQFAALLERALNAIGLVAESRIGDAEYRRKSGLWMKWRHAWVITGGSIVDGNADSIRENSVVGHGVLVNPFWGPIGSLPSDRRFANDQRLSDAERNEPDVVNRWWPKLEAWLHERGLAPSHDDVSKEKK